MTPKLHFLDGSPITDGAAGCGVFRLAGLRPMELAQSLTSIDIVAQNLCERLSRQDLEEPMQRPDERELREELVRLRAEHRDLDGQILAEVASPHSDQLLIKRLKKRKLAI